jgi:gas vesicle protein
MFNSVTRDRGDRMDGRSLGLGLLIGAAIGAGAALLMAPASGEQTRRQLRRNARRLAAQGGDTLSTLWDDADESARRFARRGMTEGRKAAVRVRERARDVAPW